LLRGYKRVKVSVAHFSQTITVTAVDEDWTLWVQSPHTFMHYRKVHRKRRPATIPLQKLSGFLKGREDAADVSDGAHGRISWHLEFSGCRCILRQGNPFFIKPV